MSTLKRGMRRTRAPKEGAGVVGRAGLGVVGPPPTPPYPAAHQSVCNSDQYFCVFCKNLSLCVLIKNFLFLY